MSNTSNHTTSVLPEWAYYEQIVYSGIVALIGIPGNILIILVFAYSKDKSTTDYMVFSMATSDLLGSIVCATFNILKNIQVIWARLHTTWFCRTSDIFALLTAVNSMWLLSATAVDRYMKICRPHSLAFTVFRAKSICLIIFAVVATGVIPLFFAARYDISTGTCLVEEEKEIGWHMLHYVIGVGCIFSFLVTASAYILVAFALYKRLKDKIRRRRVVQPEDSGNVLYQMGPVSCKIDKCSNNAGGQTFGHKSDSRLPRSGPIDAKREVVIQEAPNASCSYGNEKSKAGNKKAGMDEVLRQEQEKVIRTTIIMFLITAINILTFIVLTIGEGLAEDNVDNPGNLGFVIGYITKTSYMANYITNPILYMCMSSKFRDSVRKLFQ